MSKKAILKNQSLLEYNSFRVPATAKNWISITSTEELVQLFDTDSLPEQRLILGSGSNILFTEDFLGLIIKIDIPGLEVTETDGDEILVTAGAGMLWNDLVWHCVNNEYAGIENMALIPGTVGAAPIQNIGAYGRELMDVFEVCTAFDTLTQEMVSLDRESCGFSYRNSIFKSQAKGRYIITSLTLRLSKNFEPLLDYGTIREELTRQYISKPTIREMAEVVSRIRVEKLPDPATIGNAGSFFKNPIISRADAMVLQEKFPSIVMFDIDSEHVKIAAGWMIEYLGWRGRQIQNCGTWEKQALVLVNHGGATGKEIFNFSEKILQEVYSKFGVILEREVNVF